MDYQTPWWQDYTPSRNRILAMLNAMGIDAYIVFHWDEQDAFSCATNQNNMDKLIEAAAELMAEIEIDLSYGSYDTKPDELAEELIEIADLAICGALWIDGELVLFTKDITEERAGQVGAAFERLIEPSLQTLH